MLTDDTDLPPRPGPALLVWAVVGVQALLVLQFAAMGLGWGGVLYTVNVLQGVVLLLVAVLLAVRRRLLVVLVPVVSVVLSLGLQGAEALLNGTPVAARTGSSAHTVGEQDPRPDRLRHLVVTPTPDSVGTLIGLRRHGGGVLSRGPYRRVLPSAAVAGLERPATRRQAGCRPGSRNETLPRAARPWLTLSRAPRACPTEPWPQDLRPRRAGHLVLRQAAPGRLGNC